MKAETVLMLEKARWHLANARTIVAANIPEVAAREAYYAAFHAAEAYIFEVTGKIAKTHKGVHGEFSRLAKDDPHFTSDFLPFLGQAYDYKSISDYEVGPLAKVYVDDALDTINKAEKFVAHIVVHLT